MKALRIVPLMLLLALAVPASLLGQDLGDEEKGDHSITHHGFTGLFNVISPDTMNRGEVSFGIGHRNYDRELSDADINDLWAGFAVGVTDNIELGMSYVGNRQSDFDDAFTEDFYNNRPHPITTIENGGGDLVLGFKVALARMEDAGNGFALIGQAKLPTGDAEEGRGTGGYDFTIGAAAGIERGQLGFYGNAGYTLVGDADDDIGGMDLADNFNWGLGLELGAKNWLAGIVEITGEYQVSEPDDLPEQTEAIDLTVGFRLGGANHGGVTLAAGYQQNLAMDSDNLERPQGWVAELSYTTQAPPPLPPPPVPVDVNHDPSVSLTASPAKVYPSYSSKTNRATLTARASDPDGDPLSYSWSTSGGRVDGSGASTTWYPPRDSDNGTYTVTVQVSDGRGGQASSSATVQVIPDPEHFEGNVLFGFDKYDLDDSDRAAIDSAAKHLAAYPELRLTVEGHTCYIATEEYNLALGDRRANAVYDYLLEVGVSESRLQMISYGELRPAHDNSREITRRLNRRGEFRFRFSR